MLSISFLSDVAYFCMMDKLLIEYIVCFKSEIHRLLSWKANMYLWQVYVSMILVSENIGILVYVVSY